MLLETRFVLQLMSPLLCQNLRPQNVQMQVQKYVVKNPRQRRTLQVQVTMVKMVMTMVMTTEKANQPELKKVEYSMEIVMEKTLVADHRLNDVNDRENFLLGRRM
jgi:hypothetical protein